MRSVSESGSCAGAEVSVEVGGLARVAGDAPAAVLLVDLESRAVVYANPVAQQLAPGVVLPVGVDGWSDAAALRDLDGAELSETTHPLSLVARSEPAPGQAVSAARATELGRRREPLWVVGLPLTDAPQLSGYALVVLLPLRDRTAAQSAVTAAAGNAELRERAVLATGLSFTVADATAEDMPLIWVNPAFTAATGYRFDEAVGHNCRFLQGPATDPAAPRQMRAALAAGQEIVVTLLNYRKDGTAFWNQVAMSPISDPDGRLTHYVGIQTDVTGRVDADRERDRALAAERTAREDAERAHRQLELLAEATSRLAATLDVDESLDRLAELVVPALADWVLIALPDRHGELGTVVARHRDGRAELLRNYVDLLSSGSSARVTVLRSLLHGQPALRVSVRSPAERQQQRERWRGNPAVLDLSDELGAESVLLVPLPGRAQVVGAMAMLRGSDSPAYTEQDLSVAVDLGRRAGLILDNARLYQAEHRIAETLQRSLLPQLPDLPGVVAAAQYRASETGADVGGDFYELLPLPGDSVGVAVGDVTGHDVFAAAAMGHLRGLLRACAYDTGVDAAAGAGRQDPAAVLDRVDRLVQGLELPTLATAIYVRLDPQPDGGWLLAYSNAGHPPLLLRHPDGTVEILDDTEDLLLGLQPTIRSTRTRRLRPGTTLLAYTDGLIERAGESLDAGLDRLRRALQIGPQPVDELCRSLVDELGDSDDDVALLALHLSSPDC